MRMKRTTMTPDTAGKRGSSLATGLTAWLLPALLLWSHPGNAEKDSILKSDPELNKGPKVYGYIQVQRVNLPVDGNGDGETNEGRARVQRARLSVEGVINKHISYEMDIDPRALEVNGLMRDAYFNLKLSDTHRLRIGQQKTIFGYENQRSSSQLYMVNRSELSDNMARGVHLRDQGVSLRGRRALGGGTRLSYDVAVVNGAGMNVQRDNNKAKNVWGRVGLRNARGADRKWMWGLSAGIGDQWEQYEPQEIIAATDSTDEVTGYFIDFKRFGTDFRIEQSRFDLNGEFAIGPEKELGDEETVYAYYLTAIGKMSRPYGPLLRYEAFLDEFTRWTVGAYYGEPNDAFRVLFNYEFRWEEGDIIDNVADDRLYLWTQVRF